MEGKNTRIGGVTAPQGLCGNLINALKLLANQQEDGDGLIQNIVTNLLRGEQEGSYRGVERNRTKLTIIVPQKWDT